jgi:hypothetical protein
MEISDQFQAWASTKKISAETTKTLMRYMPDKSQYPETTDYVDSLEKLIARNYPCDIPALDDLPDQHGYILIGSCPNGDPVFINSARAQLPVFYGQYGRLYTGRLEEGMRCVADSLDSYYADLNSGFKNTPRDFWDTIK